MPEKFMEKNVWISSKEHLDDFKKISDGSNLFLKILGKYKIPVNFPRAKIFLFSVPVVFFASGLFSVNDGEVEFVSKPAKKFVVKYKNIKNENFKTNLVDAVAIGRYQAQYALSKGFSINWIEMKTNKNILGGSFLICVAEKSVGEINRETDALYNELMKSV